MKSEDQVFYLTIISMGVAFILALSRQMYKSKCSKVSFCGIVIERDTQAELEFDESHPVTEGSSNDLPSLGLSSITPKMNSPKSKTENGNKV